MGQDRIAAAFDGIDPEDLPESVDRAAVRRVRRVAYFLDESIPVPGTSYRIGVDPVLSALPVPATPRARRSRCTSSPSRPVWASRSRRFCGCSEP